MPLSSQKLINNLIKNRKPAELIVRPITEEQDSKTTKEDIQKAVNLIQLKITTVIIKEKNNGYIIVQCTGKEDLAKN